MPAEIPHKSLLENPDTGLVGTPATYSAALSVASVDNDGYTQLYITVDGQEFGYLDTAAKAATNFQENFRNKELEYVMVPGYGADSDYEGIDVTGKVAVISRGTSSFPEKQSIAQAHGAIAAIIYNNELGVIRMQINDGEGNIPAISVTLACGEALKNGSGKLTVCNGDTKLFRLDRTVSSFSSWGVTPDLKLKPEISGVGGSIYSATDPAISGGYDQVTAMAMDYTTGTMYALTLPSTWDYATDKAVSRPGSLATVDLDTGKVTKIAELDMTNKVFAMAIDKSGTMYVAGSPNYYSDASLYTMDKTSGALTKVTDLTGAKIYTGNTYYGTMQYNAQMAYDFGTDRLYLNATVGVKGVESASGMFLIQLGGETPEVYSLGGISLYIRAGSSMKYGDVYLGMMALIPEEAEVPATAPNGVVLSKDAYRISVGATAQIDARVRPANAADRSLTYAATDAAIATVSSTGLITGVKEGETTVTITTGNGLKATVKVTVVDATGPSSTAYTVTTKGDKLLSFNPSLPAETTAVIGDFSSSGSVVGLAYGDNCLYYALDTGSYPGIYRYDFVTGQSTFLGSAVAWTGCSDIAYDKDNNFLYVVGGF